MASPHRKLFPNDPNSNYTLTTVQTCLYFCNTQKNETTGFCPTSCLAICPSICHYSLSALINSPPDPYLQPNKPFQSSHKNLSPLLISMLIILASAFLVITFYTLYTKLYFQFYDQTRLNNRNPRPRGRSDLLEQDHGPTVIFHPAWYIPTVGLNPSVISAIQVRKYATGEKSGAAECTDCAVCLAEFEDEEELRVLPKCNHAFHIPCIDTWLKSHTNCPLCRAPVMAPDLDRTVENSGPTSASVSAAAGDNFNGEVRISVGETEENCVENKELGEVTNENNNNNVGNAEVDTSKNKGSGSSSSSSQRWGLERGATNLLSRSFSCGAKIFSSRYINNNNNNPNS